MTNEEIIEKFERENLTLAPIVTRIGAFFIDDMIIGFMFLIINFHEYQIVANANSPEQMLQFIDSLVIQIYLLKVIYQSFFVWMYGATPGKMLLKIRVISVDLLDNPNLAISILRSSIRVLSEWVLYLGFFWAFLNPKKETWHDKIARTLVINA